MASIDKSSFIHAQMFTRLFLDGKHRRSKTISLRDAHKLPAFTMFVPIESKADDRIADRTTISTLKWPADEIVVDHAFPMKESKLVTMQTAKKGQRDAASMIAGRESFKKMDDRSGQKAAMSHLSVDNLRQLGVEVMADCRDDLMPDPQHDGLIAIVVSVTDEHAKIIADNVADFDRCGSRFSPAIGIIFNAATCHADIAGWPSMAMAAVDDSMAARSEYHLLVAFVTLVIRLDPDIVYCWDDEKASLNFIAARSSLYGINLAAALSRMPANDFDFVKRHVLTNNDICIDADRSIFFHKVFNPVIVPTSDKRWIRKMPAPRGKSTGFGGKIVGRVTLCMWRLCREDFKLTSYALEHVFAQLFGINKPKLSAKALVGLLHGPSLEDKAFVVKYLADRLGMVSQIVDSMGIVQRTIEMAKVFTVNFESVLTRG